VESKLSLDTEKSFRGIQAFVAFSGVQVNQLLGMGCCNSKDQRWAFQGPADLLEPLRESFAVRQPEVVVIVLRLHEMKRLAAGNHLGTNTDPFCEFSVVSNSPTDKVAIQRQRSSLKSNTRNPKWFPAQRFQFKVNTLQTTRIAVNVFHFLPILQATSIGDAVIHLKDFQVGGVYKKKEVKLIRQDDGKFEGSLVVSIQVQTVEQAASFQEHYIYEFQRWKGDWGSLDCFLMTDPGRWSTLDGQKFQNEIDDIAPQVPPGWTVLREWMTGVTDDDADGWEYSTDFRSNYWHPVGEGSIYCVRRRIWSRKVAKVGGNWKDNSFGNPI